MPQSVVAAVKNRISDHGRGWCFTPKHFLDLDSDTGVRSALSRLQRDKMIRRLAQGLYEYPREHDVLGTLPPRQTKLLKLSPKKMEFVFSPQERMRQISLVCPSRDASAGLNGHDGA
jgi:Family of unknown function (DUF6088)